MIGLVEKLERFNRKERFFLVAQAVVGSPKSFGLHPAYREKLAEALGIPIPPHDVFVAMDYHLDWIYAALELVTNEKSVYESPGGADDPMLNVNANQEDIDLLVAFDTGPDTHLILIEAKGATGWKNPQMLSKAKRLAKIFCESPAQDPDLGVRYPGVIPHFILTSPPGTEPTRLTRTAQDDASWPDWMWPEGGKPNWIPLDMPVADRLRIERFDTKLDKASHEGVHWRLSQKP